MTTLDRQQHMKRRAHAERLRNLADRNRCACGGALSVAQNPTLDILQLRCGRCGFVGSDGIVKQRSLTRMYQDGAALPLTIANRIEAKEKKQMAEQIGQDKAVILAPYRQVAALNEEQATKVLTTIWPDAPQIEVTKAALICAQYHLNPLMKHIFLIGYYNKKTGRKDWSTQIGIKATRLMAVRKGTFSYLDDSPRIMSEAEQMKIYGDVAHDRIRAITILRDEKTGAVVRGYAHWMLNEEPKGTEKGNSKANMSFIRSERQAIDRLRPGEMPSDVDVADEQYMPAPQVTEVNDSHSESIRTVDTTTGEIVNGEYTDDTDDAPGSRQEAPQTALPQSDGPTTIPELLKRAYDEYGMKPPAVAKEAAVESTARIQDVPRVWAQIQARHPQRQAPLT